LLDLLDYAISMARQAGILTQIALGFLAQCSQIATNPHLSTPILCLFNRMTIPNHRLCLYNRGFAAD
jgi:hypothetical protein